MTYTQQTEAWLACDHPGCDCHSVRTPYLDVDRAEANIRRHLANRPDLGWTINAAGDYCPCHAAEGAEALTRSMEPPATPQQASGHIDIVHCDQPGCVDRIILRGVDGPTDLANRLHRKGWHDCLFPTRHYCPQHHPVMHPQTTPPDPLGPLAA